jgi:hypothetical protein
LKLSYEELLDDWTKGNGFANLFYCLGFLWTLFSTVSIFGGPTETSLMNMQQPN